MPPYLIEKVNATENSTQTDRYSGMIVDFLDSLAEEAGFDYELHLVEDGKYGSEENGKWVGMVGEVIDGVSTNYQL